MNLLEKITIQLNTTNPTFDSELLNFLEKFGTLSDSSVTLTRPQDNFLPKISLEVKSDIKPKVYFRTNNEFTSVGLVNTLGSTKLSPHAYSPIALSDLISRMKSFNIDTLDHVGFDLPCFDGVHPEITKLRNDLKNQCAYFLWPENEGWDFILPATAEEISKKVSLDFAKVRKPKFEIVSIDKVSTPIVQIDFDIKESYQTIKKTFPEGIFSDELQNVWIYIQNNQGIDLCFVVNASSRSDWSDFFSESWLS